MSAIKTEAKLVHHSLMCRGAMLAVSFHAHTTASVKEVSLPPVLVCGTPSEKFSSDLQQDVNYTHFKQALKRHILGGS